jgi:KDO2-lipid IV(A) lauroyltransferase
VSAPDGTGRFAHGARGAALDLLLAVLSRVPLPMASGFAWGIAWLWWWVLPIRRRVAAENLRRALPDVPVRPTLTRMMHDLVLGYVEILDLSRVRVDVAGAEAVPPGALLLGGHGGSWDLALLRWADAIPLAIFLRTPADPWARARIAALRAAHDVRALETGARMDAAYAALDEGRSVFFVQDQHFARGIPSPFFGRPSPTSLGIAAAALRTGRPIFGAWQWREGPGHHRLHVAPLPLPPPTGDRDADLRAITDACNGFYEAQIRARPHGWLWLHRRWR